jgi:hypothetical protein
MDPNNQQLVYKQQGFETNIEYLQFLFDWLGELADAYSSIVMLGGGAIPHLIELTHNYEVLQPLTLQLIEAMAKETQIWSTYPTQELICPQCLTRCHIHRVNPSWWQTISYYGCRVCSQSQEFFNCPQRVTAVLDSTWPETQSHHNGLLRLNWLQHRQCFDFDRVEIIQASDEDVERFVVQAGNDTDPWRSPRYAKLPCLVGPECRLSENTRRILERTFGEVTRTQVVR